MIYFFTNCIHAIRTIPVLQHDQHQPEDLDTEMEDHAYDDSRYACMSRPYTGDAPMSDEERERSKIIKAQQDRVKAAQKERGRRRGLKRAA
jgi:hypothetical protein